ncbi:MAG: zinc ribbon domain-containing protein [Lachnospiraceae bacterium]|nr:zinc ribbon domain-containing protein [Lachnospiraceae bacterium]
MFCTNCGAKIQEGARFCSSCGTRLNIAPAGQQEAPQMGQQVVFVLVWRLAQKDEPIYIYRSGYVNPAFAMQGGMPGIAKSE